MKLLLAIFLLAVNASGAGFRMPEWTPLCIPGCALYYTGDGGMGLNSTGGVTVWLDYSGFGRHATQSVAVNLPGFTNNIINGHGTVGFHGATNWLDANCNNGQMSNATTNGTTIFTVVKTVSTSKNRIFSTTTATAGYLGMYAPYSDGNIYWETANQSTGRQTKAGNFNAFTDVCWSRNANVSSIYTNGATMISGAISAIPASNTNKMYIGAFGPGTQDYLRGQLYILLVYNRALTTAEQTRVDRWLCNKIGLISP